MRILQIHNTYQQGGGEDAVVANESRLLHEHGDTVETYSVSNNEIRSVLDKFSAAVSVGYSYKARKTVSQKISKFRPDVAHVHNTFPLLTPSVYDACAQHQVPVVQTLHNYRIGCINGFLLRQGAVCEKCWQGSPHWGAVHGCYRGSRIGSIAPSIAFAYHRYADTWNRKVSCFIALTEFARAKFEEFGVQADKIAVKPNFVDDPGQPLGQARNGALFVGRLSREKGIIELVQAWNGIPYPLTVIGDGPLFSEVKRIAPSQVNLVGSLSPPEVRRRMHEAAFLIIPSLWYETFGMVVVEAFACGLPVLGAAIGGVKELLASGAGGRLFAPASVPDLKHAIIELIEDDTARLELGRSARALYEKHYTPSHNYQTLKKIYLRAMERPIENVHSRTTYG